MLYWAHVLQCIESVKAPSVHVVTSEDRLLDQISVAEISVSKLTHTYDRSAAESVRRRISSIMRMTMNQVCQHAKWASDQHNQPMGI